MRNAWDEMLPERAFIKRAGLGNRPMTLEGGPSGGQPSSVSQTTIPEYAQPYMENLLGQAGALTIGSTTTDPDTGEEIFTPPPGYQAYPDQRIADPNERQTLARQNILGIQPIQGYQAGKNLTQEGVAGIKGIQDQFTGQTVSDYMSPYMQNVVDIQKGKAVEDAQLSQLGANLGSVGQGTLGGSRQALAQGMREEALGEQLGNIQATGQQQAYDSAMAQLERDRSAQMAKAEGIAGLGSQLAGLDQSDLQSRLGLFGTQEAVGQQLRADQQALLTQDYSDFQDQQRFPYSQIGFFSDVLRGSGNLAGTGGEALYAPQPSSLQNIADTGINALQLYQMNQMGKTS